MKHLFFVVYNYSFGQTHISLYVEGEKQEWAYGDNGIKSYTVGKFDVEYPNIREAWYFSRLISACLVPDDFSIEKYIEESKTIYTGENYHLLNRNCWMFAANIIERADLKTYKDTMSMIYKISDFEWNMCPYTTYIGFNAIKYMNFSYDYIKENINKCCCIK
tara:strand:- start:633 stop:1118 length:486 start_codon:yes stop_codon:yes gene_type:complete